MEFVLMKNMTMKNISMKIILSILILLLSGVSAQAQFKQESSRSLFSDVKAFQEGDALMVLIMEETQAQNSASTAESRDTDIGGGLKAGSGSSGVDVNAGIGTSNDFKASGTNTRSETIKSRLSVRVISVESNGNLSIEGRRTTQIDGETQTIVIKGIIRTVDIRPDNSIYSYSILDLTLIIEGEGNIKEIQEPGLITKFLRFLF
jgi:flagellar L-ring protein FlgH